jgi:hypothetical protein
MKLNDTARLLIGSTPATLDSVNRDGGPQVSVVGRDGRGGESGMRERSRWGFSGVVG